MPSIHVLQSLTVAWLPIRSPFSVMGFNTVRLQGRSGDVSTATPDDIISNRVAQNARYYQHKKDRPESTHRLNVADDVLSVLNMFQNSPFIREVITTCSSKPPSIILYTDLQMAMLKSAIASGTVIGIDRTFNLSSCFLTPLCFPNVNLESKQTSMPPVMLGPMMLHWDGNMDSYHKFTSHLQAKLADIDQTNLIFGSDEEFAAVKAVHLSFPNATRVFCAKHLKDNAIVNLGKSLPQPEVTKIITKLFGESVFWLQKTRSRSTRFAMSWPTHMTYSTCLTGCFPIWSSSLTSLGYDAPVCLVYGTTTNESYNNVIKRDTNWVIQKLPDLVTKLYELEQDQTRDVRGALFDKGKYVLSKQAAVLKVSYEIWTQLLPAQRSRRLLKFVNFKAKASSTLTSTGGLFFILISFQALSRVFWKF